MVVRRCTSGHRGCVLTTIERDGRIEIAAGAAVHTDLAAIFVSLELNSRQALQIVQRLQAEGAICLRGNHEELMLQATELEGDLANFLANGGDATITSLRTPAAFQRAHEWVRALPTSHEDELRYYVHAGICPGVPLDQQTAETKLWIRDGFLRHRRPFPKYIVHGHTPTIYFDPQQTMPDVRDNRCNVDTGAGMNGPLSAAIFNDRQTKPIHTISVGAEN